MIRVSIAGGSGYTGGELLRLLLAHPEVEVAQITASAAPASFVHFTHPNLRASSKLKFVTLDELTPCDVLFLGLPHGSAMESIDRFAELAKRIVDLSADFRLRDPALYESGTARSTRRRRGSTASSTACPSSTASGCARPPT